MKLKKFVAPTMPEAMNQIRKELGPDAVILNSKKVKDGGFLGLFKKMRIEVVAVLDPEPAEQRGQTLSVPKSAAPRVQLALDEREVLSEIRHLKKMIRQQTVETGSGYTTDYQSVFCHLLDQEVEEHLAREIMDAVVQNQAHTDPAFQVIVDTVALEIAKRLNVHAFQGISCQKQVIHFVGPTGVGKTTTLAKTAADAILNDNKTVAFITTDTYRIAAVEQLRTYARILDVPVEVAYTEEEYQIAVSKFKKYDIIFVDTAGRNFREHKYIKELKKMTSNINTKTYLVLSLTSKASDITEITERFRELDVKKVIFTKVDETKQYGIMLNIVLNHGKEIAYLTNGQDVPEDLLHPGPEQVSRLIMGGLRNV